jgi:hypothetical protein
MKKVISLAFLLISFISLHAQWIPSDSSLKVMHIKYNNDDFTYLYHHADLLFCGLDTDDSNYKHSYYRRQERSDLLFVKSINLKDSSMIFGFYRLKFFNDTVFKNGCWIRDYVWLFFDKNQRLLKQEFYDDTGLSTPMEFILIKEND